jgi:membrane-bound acyltransferase YfiQ involved in biofilm formation
MIFVLIILVAILFMNMKVTPQGEFHTDYCSLKQTATINGLFTLLIFFSHASQYVTLDGALDEPYLAFRKYIGQLVVASFLFFSGFGIMESIKKKGINYVKGIPKKRLFKVWYHFAVAILLYIAVDLVLQREYSLKDTILSFTGYKTVGNSGWYLFVTFCMYIIIFISFMISRKSNIAGVIIVFALTIAFTFWEINMGLADRFYNTIFCFPVGMLFSLIKPYFDKVIMKNDIIYALMLLVFLFAFNYFSITRNRNIINYNLFAIFTVFIIMAITMKIKIGNAILDFFGNHVFSFFILQRIPMIILTEVGVNKNKYLFITFCFIITICLSLIFDKCMSKTDKLIYKK